MELLFLQAVFVALLVNFASGESRFKPMNVQRVSMYP